MSKIWQNPKFGKHIYSGRNLDFPPFFRYKQRCSWGGTKRGKCPGCQVVEKLLPAPLLDTLGLHPHQIAGSQVVVEAFVPGVEPAVWLHTDLHQLGDKQILASKPSKLPGHQGDSDPSPPPNPVSPRGSPPLGAGTGRYVRQVRAGRQPYFRSASTLDYPVAHWCVLQPPLPPGGLGLGGKDEAACPPLLSPGRLSATLVHLPTAAATHMETGEAGSGAGGLIFALPLRQAPHSPYTCSPVVVAAGGRTSMAASGQGGCGVRGSWSFSVVDCAWKPCGVESSTCRWGTHLSRITLGYKMFTNQQSHYLNWQNLF